MDTQEWLSENTNRRLPFAEVSASATGIDLDALSRWVSDLRVFASAYEQVDCWISSILYEAEEVLTFEGEVLTLNGESITLGRDVALTLDGEVITLGGEPLTTLLSGGGTYFISLSNSTGVIASFSVPIIDDSGTPGYGMKRHAFDNNIVVTYVPGPGWGDPWSIGLEDGDTLQFTTPDEIESTTVHPTNVNTGIRGFKGFYLQAPFYDTDGNLVEVDETTPGTGEFPAASTNRIQAGYNMELKQSGDFLDLNLVPGAGSGLYPCGDDDCGNPIRSISGVIPNKQGNISLRTYDCLRQSGLTDINPGASFPSPSGIKIYSDCLPCCTCRDYNDVSTLIGGLGSALLEMNDDLIRVLNRSQGLYDEAVDLINSRTQGLAVVYQIGVLPDQVKIHVMNVSNTPIYGIMSISTTPPGGLVLESGQTHVTSGISGSFSGLSPSEQDTGITDINDVVGWQPGEAVFTVGYGDGGGPIPPAGISTVAFYSQGARDKLEALTEVCANLQIFRGGAVGQEVLDNDIDYQDLLTEFDELSIIDGDCLDGTDFGTNDEGYDSRYRCNVQEQADGIRRQELRDKMLARKYELCFDTEVCGGSVMTAEMAQLIDDLRSLEGMVSGSCKDGFSECEDLNTAPGVYNWSCGAAIYSDSCQASIRDQRVERSRVYLRLEKVLRDQLDYLEVKLIDCLSDGMIADLVGSMDICMASVFGSGSFACGSSLRTFTIGRETSGEYDCLEKIISLVSLTTTEQ